MTALTTLPAAQEAGVAPVGSDIWQTIASFPYQILTCGLSSIDSKLHDLVVGGRILQGIAVIGSIVTTLSAFLITPLAFFGFIPAFVLGLLGTYATCDPLAIHECFNPPPPFVPGQPIGLTNTGSNCWANSALQLLLNAPNLLRNACRFPEIDQFSQLYSHAQESHERCLKMGDSNSIRKWLHQVTEGQIGLQGNEDAAVFFETVFEGNNGIHHFHVDIDGEPSNPRREPFVALDIGGGSDVAFEQLLDQFFNPMTDDGQQIKLIFERAPDDLLVQIKRFYQEPIPGEEGVITIADRVNLNAILIPMEFALPDDAVHEPAHCNYTCDGFIVHSGTLTAGHYVSYIKKDAQWWVCNDGYARPVTEEDAADGMKRGYIYHFNKKNELA